MRRSRPFAALGIAALLSGGALVFAAPAQAAGPVRTAASPACVDITDSGKEWGFPFVKVKNNCSGTQRVKVLWAGAPDSSCNVLKPGKSFKDSTGVLGRFDGLQKC